MEKKLWVILAIYLPVIFWLSVLAYLAVVKDFHTLLAIIAGGAILRLLCEVIYFFYQKPRPYQVLNVVPPHAAWLFSPYKKRPDSFPSAHAADLFFGSLFLLASHFYLLGLLAFLVAVLNGFGRVKLLYHYKVDILAGAGLALIWLIFVRFVVKI